MPSHKNRFSFLGLAGLTLLVPVLFFFYGFKANTLIKANAILLDANDNYTANAVYTLRRDNGFRIFTFTGNAREELQTLKEARLAIQKMISSQDTLVGVKIHLSDKTSYNTFIQTYTLMHEERVEYFGIDNDNFWVINVSESEKELFKYGQ